jgi:protein SCO1/2
MISKFAALILSGVAAFAAPKDLPSDSVYQLSSTWTNQAGKKISLKDLGGKPVIMTLIYTSCPTACPLTVADLGKVDGKLPAEQRQAVRYVLVSLDSERDNPKTLKKFMEKFKLDNRWTMLVGSADDVRELAATLGFQYKKLADGEFSHATTIYAFNKQGQITAKRDQSEEYDTFVGAVAKSISGK